MLWNQYCLVYLSVVCGGRAVPFMWVALEHKSSMVAFEQYQLLLDKAKLYLDDFSNVMLLADRGFANHALIAWLKANSWHWCIRLPVDTMIQGVSRRGFGREVHQIYPPKGQAKLYHPRRFKGS